MMAVKLGSSVRTSAFTAKQSFQKLLVKVFSRAMPSFKIAVLSSGVTWSTVNSLYRLRYPDSGQPGTLSFVFFPFC